MKKLFLLFACFAAFAQEEAKENLSNKTLFEEEATEQFNEKLFSLKKQLKELSIVQTLENQQQIKDRLEKVQAIKKEITFLEQQWKDERVQELKDEEFVFWDQGQTTIADLVMEYGSTDFLYVIPPEIGKLKITLHSQIPLPHESWDDMIKLILSQNGVGVKETGPFCKQLYSYRLDLGQVEEVVRTKEQLALIEDTSRVFYVFSPPAEQMKSAHFFFERFSDKKITQVHAIGSQIVLVSTKEIVAKLVDLYQAVLEEEQGKKMEVLSLTKLGVAEGEKVLKEFFVESMSKGRATFFKSEGQTIKVIALSHENSLVLIGPGKMIEKAKSLIEDVEAKLKDPDEMTIYWYTCKHSDPEDLAGVLEQVYSSLLKTPIEEDKTEKKKCEPAEVILKSERQEALEGSSNAPVNPVSAPKVEPGVVSKKSQGSYDNFIVDGKTGSILMVVRADQLDRLKDVIERLDVPKKMVQIDVLLVERKIMDRKRVGVNLLRIGNIGDKPNNTEISFNTNTKAVNKGLLDFIITRQKSSAFPAFDLTYQFLLAQENMNVNANPSILAINQTPATISIVEEISINNGAVIVEPLARPTAAEQSFTRTQYGITIVITPTIHVSEEGEGFVTMQTHINFDTTPTQTANERPNVGRRQIKNEVRIADGETVILGGLRRKSHEDRREKVPFLGDIPGIGKLFGLTNIDDITTEMMFFITPRIIHDPICDLRKMRKLLVQRRPGDMPEFLEKLESAKQEEKMQLLEQSFSLMWDKL